MKFDKFPIDIAIKENLIRLGYHRTTDIQFKVIPAILNGEDILAIAQTGSGKTAAFAIPLIHLIHEFKTSKKSYGVKCLVLVPTRELAKQIGEVLAKLSRYTKTTTYAIYGGVEQDPQIEQLKGGVDILVATPGRMFDLISQKYIDVRNVSYLVLDEADQMLDLGFIDDIENIKRILDRKHQTLFFSATINPKIKKLAYSQIKSNALRIQISPEKMINKNINHVVVRVEMEDKRHVLTHFIKNNPDLKCMIFTRTQVRADRVTEYLKKNGIECLNIHGGLEQKEREANLSQFNKSPKGWLIATDVTARGIDIPDITHVINYDLPDNPEKYIHRIGRTGRGFAKGDAISFVSSIEKPKLAAIEEFINTKIQELKLDAQMLIPYQEADEKLDFSDFINQVEKQFEKKKRKFKDYKKKEKSQKD